MILSLSAWMLYAIARWCRWNGVVDVDGVGVDGLVGSVVQANVVPVLAAAGRNTNGVLPPNTRYIPPAGPRGRLKQLAKSGCD